MTEREFLKLKIGAVVSRPSPKNELFVIYDDDQFGDSFKGDRYRVFGGKQIDTDNPKYIRIDIRNCMFWTIEGHMSNN